MDHSPTIPAIAIKNLAYRYFEFSPPALTDVSLEIPSGSCTAVLGASGAGKTTLLQILCGAGGTGFSTAVASGSIRIGEETFEPIPKRTLFPAIGYSMQDPVVQISGIRDTVEEEIAFTLDNLGVRREEQSRRITAIVSKLGLASLVSRKPTHLSGGELHMVLLASILVAQPSVLLLDEPANSLDSLSQQRLKLLLRSMLKTTTVILTDYQIEFALDLASYFVVLDHGNCLFSGTRNTFIERLTKFEGILPIEGWRQVLQAQAGAGSGLPLRWLRSFTGGS